jgi:hypothetical protein
VYENVAITKVGTSRSEGTGEAGTFEVSFTEFRIVRLKKVAIDANIVVTELDTSASQQSAPPVNMGTQALEKVDYNTSISTLSSGVQ